MVLNGGNENNLQCKIYALEWILSRKWDDWSWTSMTIKVVKRFFHQNYTNFSLIKLGLMGNHFKLGDGVKVIIYK